MPAENAIVRSIVSVFRSRNGGRTFDLPTHVRPNNLRRNGQTAAILSDGSLIISFVETNQSDGRRLAQHHAWVARSSDGGETWERAASEIQNPDIHCVLVTAGPPKTVFVLVNNDVWTSIDDGESWRELTALRQAPTVENRG